jgi:hypothetical protein
MFICSRSNQFSNGEIESHKIIRFTKCCVRYFLKVSRYRYRYLAKFVSRYRYRKHCKIVSVSRYIYFLKVSHRYSDTFFWVCWSFKYHVLSKIAIIFISSVRKLLNKISKDVQFENKVSEYLRCQILVKMYLETDTDTSIEM